MTAAVLRPARRHAAIYASEETMVHLRRVFVYAFHQGPWPRGYFMPEEKVFAGSFEIGDLKITPLDLPHGRMTTTGFYLNKTAASGWPT